MSRSKNRKIADLISGGTFDDGVVAASEVTGLATVATSGSFNDLSNQPTPFDPSTLGTASTQATGAFATAAQGTTANAALPKAGGAVTGNVTFGDSNKVVMGAGSDLELYHDGSHSYIKENGTGQLKIRSNGTGVILQTVSGENLATFANNAAVTLYNNNASKMSTTTSGIDVTGTVNADALTGIGSIDATTKNAISAAGVGGNTVFLGETLITSNASYIQYNFPSGYQRFVFQMVGWKTNTSWRNMFCRLTDASNNLLSSSGMYARSPLSANSSDIDNEIKLGTLSGAADTAPASNMVLNIESPRDSNTATFIKAIGSAKDSSQVIPNAYLGARIANEQNNGIRFYITSGSIGSGSYSYRVWGIK